MAKKQIEMQVRWRVSAEIEQGNLEAVLTTFLSLGITNVGYEMITDIATFRQKKQFAKPPRKMIDEYIAAHEEFTVREVLAVLEKEGITYQAIYGYLSELQAGKTLARIAPGRYRRQDTIKLIEHHPKPSAKPKTVKPKQDKPPRKPRGLAAFGMSGAELIWKKMKHRAGTFTNAELERLFEAAGRSPKSVSPQIKKLLDDKVIARVEEGKYKIIGKLKTVGEEIAKVKKVKLVPPAPKAKAVVEHQEEVANA